MITKEDSMWTRSIRLEEITPNEFQRLRRMWYKDQTPLRNSTRYSCALIKTPVIAVKYEDLIDLFTCHELAQKINVRVNPYQWNHFYKNEINQTMREEIITLAEKDAMQRHHFEMKFYSLTEEPKKGAVIDFTKTETGLIVSHGINLHKSDKKLFDCQMLSSYERIHGICDVF